MTTESTLRAALQEAQEALPKMDERETVYCSIRGDHLRALVKAALSAHPARASQGELSDEQIEAAQGQAYRDLVAQGYTGGMGSQQWDIASARAVIAADRAARPESVDARRYRWLKETMGNQHHGLPSVEAAFDDDIDDYRWAGFFGIQQETLDAAIDSAIANMESKL